LVVVLITTPSSTAAGASDNGIVTLGRKFKGTLNKREDFKLPAYSGLLRRLKGLIEKIRHLAPAAKSFEKRDIGD
jgi:hypothetical protein